MSQRLVHAMVALVFVSVLSVFALAVMVPGNAVAGPHPIAVAGYVYDLDGRTIADIPLTINMKVGETTISTNSTTSGSDGGYIMLFDTDDWEVGCTVQIIATGPSGQAFNSTTAPNDFDMDLDVHFSYAIPEFGFDAGILVAGGAVCLIAVGILVWKRK